MGNLILKIFTLNQLGIEKLLFNRFTFLCIQYNNYDHIKELYKANFQSNYTINYIVHKKVSNSLYYLNIIKKSLFLLKNTEESLILKQTLSKSYTHFH